MYGGLKLRQLLIVASLLPENGRCVYEWIAEYTSKNGELSEDEMQSSVEMSLSILDRLSFCYLFVTHSLNSSLLLVHSAIHLRTHLILLKIPD